MFRFRASNLSVNGFFVKVASLEFLCERKAQNGGSAVNARFCSPSLRNMSPARPRQSSVFSRPGRGKEVFFPTLLKQRGVSSSMTPWTFLSATRTTERLPSLRSRALLRPAREARFSVNPRRNLRAVERCPLAPYRASSESSTSQWPRSVGG